jgi:hypothetical protein
MFLFFIGLFVGTWIGVLGSAAVHWKKFVLYERTLEREADEAFVRVGERHADEEVIREDKDSQGRSLGSHRDGY